MGIEQRSNAGAHLGRGLPAGASTMRAAVQHRYGPPSVLEPSEVAIPLPVQAMCSSRLVPPRYIPATTSS